MPTVDNNTSTEGSDLMKWLRKLFKRREDGHRHWWTPGTSEVED
jgi:hypothetical protein